MPSAQTLARDLADMKRRIAALERAGRLSNASIDDIAEDGTESASVDVPTALATGMVAGVAAASAQATAADASNTASAIKTSGDIKVQTETQSYGLQRVLGMLTQFTGNMQLINGVGSYSVASTSYESVMVDANANPRAFDQSGLTITPIADGGTFGDGSIIDGVVANIVVRAYLRVATGGTAPSGNLFVRYIDGDLNPIKTHSIRLGANQAMIVPFIWQFPYTHKANFVTLGGQRIEARLSASGASYTIDGTDSFIEVTSTIADWSKARV